MRTRAPAQYIIFLDFEIERAAGTAMLSTAVLMSVVALCYIPEFRPVVLAPYLGAFSQAH